MVPLHKVPLLIWQAMQVRRTALRLPEADGARTRTIGNGPPISLLIIGDSSAAGVGVDHQNEALAGQIAQHLAADFSVSWTLRARTGATTASSLRALKHDAATPVDVVLVVLGVNDVTHMVPVRRWLKRQRALVASLRTQANPRAIYLTGLPPMGQFPLLPEPLRGVLGSRANALDAARRVAMPQTPHLIHAALPGPFEAEMMAKDGFHPGAAAYALWGKEMASRIKSGWPFKQS